MGRMRARMGLAVYHQLQPSGFGTVKTFNEMVHFPLKFNVGPNVGGALSRHGSPLSQYALQPELEMASVGHLAENLPARVAGFDARSHWHNQLAGSSGKSRSTSGSGSFLVARDVPQVTSTETTSPMAAQLNGFGASKDSQRAIS